MANIKDIKCFLLDMDGTFYLGNELIEGALEFLDILKKQGFKIIEVRSVSNIRSSWAKRNITAK